MVGIKEVMTMKAMKAMNSAIPFAVLVLLLVSCTTHSAVRADDNVTMLLENFTEKLRDEKPVTIVAFGDSISEVGRSPNWHGGATRPENNWAQRLGSLLQRAYPKSPITIVNAGIGGQNAYEGLGRIDSLEALKPDLVLIEFGTNDCVFHFLEPEQTQLALTTLAQEIKRRWGADVALMSTAGDNPLAPFFKHRDETIEATRRAAGAAKVLFIEMRMPMLNATHNGERWAKYHLSTNNCHPNDEGHRVWAQTVFNAICSRQ
jgi:lysophospholipase L1-like esterase